MGLQSPDYNRQLRPGLWIYCVTRDTLHARANNNADFGSPGRYSSEDRRGAEFNGSALVFQVIVSVSCFSLDQTSNKNQNGFLVVTFSSGIIASLPGLANHPTGVPTILAQNLPKSSTFFLT